jgi:hypothetical protein
MVMKFRTFVKEKWESMDATPVVILPYESHAVDSSIITAKVSNRDGNSEKVQKHGNGSVLNLKSGTWSYR